MQTEIMPISTGPPSSSDAELYLHTVEELSRQLERAMQAIAVRALPELEESVGQQRAACGRLLELPRYFGPSGQLREPGSPAPALDADLAARMSAAVDKLQTLNRSYAALLEHSGETMRQFTRLFRGYRTPAGAAGFQARWSTWSCEV